MSEEPPKTPIERTLYVLVAAVSSLSAVITIIGTFSKSFIETTTILGKLSSPQLGLISFLLLLVAVWSLVQSRRRRSVLVNPDALRLVRTNPDHLKGRDDDLDYLLPLVRTERLVFLEGESGAGKSALLWSGLLPKLRTVPRLLPILVESLVGDDWEHEPRRFVAMALSKAMSETLTIEQRKKLFDDDVGAPERVMGALGDMFPALGLMPVLLLDQFDDYQNRFMDKFLIRKSWLKPEELVATNGFWAEIKTLLDAGRLHCLIATRTDTAGGLASVRFRTPGTYRLDRLKGRFVFAIINTLIGSLDAKVVSDPERGWFDLVKRLTNDLERGGAILPQQLRIVLLGLGTMPHRVMTVGAFERAGGVPGLEARFIEDCIDRVARLAAVSPGQLRAMLLAMVDPDTSLKTIEQSAKQIAKAAPGIAADQLTIALEELERLEVTRRRGGAVTGSQKWILDHDYLARAVREVDRRANRWTRDLAEGVEKLGNAGASWSLRWRALLPPRTQLMFLADWVRGRFRYGLYRRYAVISAARFSPYLFVLFILASGGILEYQQVQTRRMEDAVATQLNRLTFDPIRDGTGYDVGVDDAAALISIASLDDLARLHALGRAISDSSRRPKLLRQPKVVIAAFIGTSTQRRNLASSLLALAVATQVESHKYHRMRLKQSRKWRTHWT